MRITVRGKNIEVTDALREYVEKRLGKLAKYVDNLDEAQVALSVEREHHVVEVTIPLNGMLLRGEEKASDMYASIDLVVEKLEKQINKYKTRINKRSKNQPVRDLTPAGGAPGRAEEEADAFRVVRTKRFALKPMPIDEAIMQMNLLGHNFFMFTNAETEEVNVVYRRQDGDYGLIEPEYE